MNVAFMNATMTLASTCVEKFVMSIPPEGRRVQIETELDALREALKGCQDYAKIIFRVMRILAFEEHLNNL